MKKYFLFILISLTIILAGCSSPQKETPSYYDQDLQNFCEIGCVEMGLLVDDATSWIKSFKQAEEIKNTCFDECAKQIKSLNKVEVVQNE